MPHENSNYTEFFGKRRRLLEDRINEIEQSIQRLQSERDGLRSELDKLVRVMQILEAKVGSFTKPQMTIKQGVIEVLTGAGRGLSALEILERLRVDLNMNYPRESLSPQLSRLKSEGKIGLNGGVWFLTKAAQE